MPAGSSRSQQPSFDDLGPELIDVDFVVFDLETTGTNPELDAITEIGAVRVQGGHVVEEFQTFVNPERHIPAYIASLTGITDFMVRDAPSAAAVIPMFLEFARTSVLVAHNAKFDVGFMKSHASRLGYKWPSFEVVDTLALARRTFTRDEVPNHRLGTLARAVGASTVPNHRALSDARATADVLHEIISRLSGHGAARLPDLTRPVQRATPAQMRQRHLAESIPAVPGVYSFVDERGDALYVGKSQNLRSRVRSYFTSQEKRKAVLQIIPATHEIKTLECSSDTEASIQEIRLIAKHKPPANRAGIRPSPGNWIRLGTGNEGIRLARTVKAESAGAAYIGPLRSRHDFEPIRSLLYAALLPDRAASFEATSSGDPAASISENPHFHRALEQALTTDPSDVLKFSANKMRELTARGQFENAESIRARTELFLNAAMRAARLRALACVPLIIGAQKVPWRPKPGTVSDASPATSPLSWQWELLSIRHGRLLEARLLESWQDPLREVEKIRAEVASFPEEESPLCFGHHQESELLLEWLSNPATRIVHVEGEWSMPHAARFTMDELQRQFRWTAPA